MAAAAGDGARPSWDPGTPPRFAMWAQHLDHLLLIFRSIIRKMDLRSSYNANPFPIASAHCATKPTADIQQIYIRKMLCYQLQILGLGLVRFFQERYESGKNKFKTVAVITLASVVEHPLSFILVAFWFQVFHFIHNKLPVFQICGLYMDLNWESKTTRRNITSVQNMYRIPVLPLFPKWYSIGNIYIVFT